VYAVVRQFGGKKVALGIKKISRKWNSLNKKTPARGVFFGFFLYMDYMDVCAEKNSFL
jgi:hypothetical protein